MNDYIGDAVWLLAWRIFEKKNFNNFSGWHRCLRSQIVVSNGFMNMVAKEESIKPIGESDKSLADGLESFLGGLEFYKPGFGVEIALLIMTRRINVLAIQKRIDYAIKNNKHDQMPRRPNIKRNFVLPNTFKNDLGELY